MSDLKPGKSVFVRAVKGADGMLSANNVTVEERHQAADVNAWVARARIGPPAPLAPPHLRNIIFAFVVDRRSQQAYV